MNNPSHNPFNRGENLPASTNVGAVAIEQERAIAEAQGQLVLAKRFPRDEFAAYEKLMKSCGLHSLAKVAFYNVPRAGGMVSGPSIRLAEEIARVYGNFEYGHKELSRDDKKSEVMVYAWDKENNNYSTRQITVFHVIDTKQGPKPCRDQKDIDDKIANVASKQMRGRIMALLPKWMVEEAINKCRETLSGNSIEPIDSQVRRLMQSFAIHGVTTAHVKDFIGCDVADITADQLVDLIGVYNSINDGGMRPSEFFGSKLDEDEKPKGLASERIKSVTQKQEDNPINAEPENMPEPDPAFTQLMEEISMCEQSSDFASVKKRITAEFDKASGEGQTLIAAFNSKHETWKQAQNNPAAD